MIIKPRKYPVSILSLEALQRRLKQNHPQHPQIKEELAKKTAGFKGEQSIDYFLSFLTEGMYHILHDVRLKIGDHFFQIDILILSRRFLLILEVKNITGTLFFDRNFNQLIRTQGDKRVAFPDPIMQVNRQYHQLKKWLIQNKYKNIPIIPLVIISSPRTILETSHQNDEIYHKIIHSAKLPQIVSKLERTYEKNILTERQLSKLDQLISECHTEPSINILSQYKISENEVLKGVICPNCTSLPMNIKRGKWICPSCTHISKDAHIEALKDYSLLIDQQITNSQLRDFLQVPSIYVGTKLLTSLNLTHTGKNKGRVYHLNSRKELFY